MAIIIGIGIDLGILVLTLVLVFEARAQVQKMLTMNGYCRLSLHILRSISASRWPGFFQWLLIWQRMIKLNDLQYFLHYSSTLYLIKFIFGQFTPFLIDSLTARCKNGKSKSIPRPDSSKTDTIGPLLGSGLKHQEIQNLSKADITGFVLSSILLTLCINIHIHKMGIYQTVLSWKISLWCQVLVLLFATVPGSGQAIPEPYWTGVQRDQRQFYKVSNILKTNLAFYSW